MASGKWYRSDNHPRNVREFVDGPHNWSRRGRVNTNQTSNFFMNNEYHQQFQAKDDEDNAYAVNLLLKPVEMGITGRNTKRYQEFKGLGAFNHYFGLLAPSRNIGYTLPDIWDGYFHITLAKFSTNLSPEQLEEQFVKFCPSLQNLMYIPDIRFKATRIEKFSGAKRQKDRKGIDFVILPIDLSPEVEDFITNIQPLLDEIEKRTKSDDWTKTPDDKLHVTIRKYSNIDHNLSQIKISEFPLEFQCSHLEVKQSRDQALKRFKEAQDNQYKWWNGVTEINRRCSGCNALVTSKTWEGFCLTCGGYESIVPIWSTDGRNISYCSQVQQ